MIKNDDEYDKAIKRIIEIFYAEKGSKESYELDKREYEIKKSYER